jgi:hypothetical protein
MGACAGARAWTTTAPRMCRHQRESHSAKRVTHPFALLPVACRCSCRLLPQLRCIPLAYRPPNGTGTETMEDVMLAVKKDWASKKIPADYFMFDSWWYPKDGDPPPNATSHPWPVRSSGTRVSFFPSVCCFPQVYCCFPHMVCCFPQVYCCFPHVYCCFPHVYSCSFTVAYGAAALVAFLASLFVRSCRYAPSCPQRCNVAFLT